MGHGSLSIIFYVGSRGVCSRLSIDCGEEPDGVGYKFTSLWCVVNEGDSIIEWAC